jgi:hypothetical protein
VRSGRGCWATALGSGMEADCASSSGRKGSLKDAITLAMCIASGCIRFILRCSSSLGCPATEMFVIAGSLDSILSR